MPAFLEVKTATVSACIHHGVIKCSQVSSLWQPTLVLMFVALNLTSMPFEETMQERELHILACGRVTLWLTSLDSWTRCCVLDAADFLLCC